MCVANQSEIEIKTACIDVSYDIDFKELKYYKVLLIPFLFYLTCFYTSFGMLCCIPLLVYKTEFLIGLLRL